MNIFKNPSVWVVDRVIILVISTFAYFQSVPILS